MEFYIFHFIWDVILPIDFHSIIFQDGYPLVNSHNYAKYMNILEHHIFEWENSLYKMVIDGSKTILKKSLGCRRTWYRWPIEIDGLPFWKMVDFPWQTGNVITRLYLFLILFFAKSNIMYIYIYISYDKLCLKFGSSIVFHWFLGDRHPPCGLSPRKPKEMLAVLSEQKKKHLG